MCKKKEIITKINNPSVGRWKGLR